MSTSRKKDQQAGMITVEFLISLVISSIFCVILFAFCFTFTVVEVSQYIAFSASRAHMAAHEDVAKQKEAATKKFNSFMNNQTTFAPLFKNGWFELTINEIRSSEARGTSFKQDYDPGNLSQNSSYSGVRLTFNAKLLSLNFAFLGSTDPDDKGFKAFVTGLLIREPTASECRQFFETDNRYRAILGLDPSRFSNYGGFADKHVPMEDNGC